MARTGSRSSTRGDQRDRHLVRNGWPALEEQGERASIGIVRVELCADIAVRHEREVVSERLATGEALDHRPAAATDIFASGAVIDVLVSGEEVDMQKRARVVEEVEISEDAVRRCGRCGGRSGARMSR